jgi:hypothetical protein
MFRASSLTIYVTAGIPAVTNRFHPDSALEGVIKNLHETYQCRLYSMKLLMMGREDVPNM